MRTLFLVAFLVAIVSVTLPLHAGRPPRAEGWVNDFARVLSPAEREKMNALLAEVEEKTGAEVVVVTARSIAPEDEKTYARALFDEWKPGKKGKDNGAIVLLAVTERRWRIEVGYGLEGILPDGRCGEIGRIFMVPSFKEGRYGQGLWRGSAAVSKVIADDAHVTLGALGDMDVHIPTEEEKAANMVLFLALMLLGAGIYMVAGYIAWLRMPPAKRGRFRLSGIGAYGGGHYSGRGGFGGGGFGGFGGGGGGGAGGGF